MKAVLAISEQSYGPDWKVALSGAVAARPVLRDRPEAGAGPVSAGPFCPWRSLQLIFENATVVAGSLLRNPSTAAWREATQVSLPAHLAALLSVPGSRAAPERL